MDYEMLNLKGIEMNTKSFRLCIFVLDELLSCYDCCQFLAPVPTTAHVYHTEIKQPMDFTTLEQRLYKNMYPEFEDFDRDLQLIWNNAKSFHRPFDLLYQQAVNLQNKYESIMKFVQGGNRKPKFFSTSVPKPDEYTKKIAPEERINKGPILYKQIDPPAKSVLYFIQAIGEHDTNAKKIRGFSNTRYLFQNMNYSFFKYMENNDREALPLPRFYIAKNRTLLHEAQQNTDGLLAILYDLKIEPHASNPDLLHLNTTVILAEPLGDIHGFDITSMNDTENKYENCPKAWIKLRALKIVHNVDTTINTTMEKSFFRRAYNTFRISPKIPADLKKIRNDQVALQFVRDLLNPVSSSTPSPSPLPLNGEATSTNTLQRMATDPSLSEKIGELDLDNGDKAQVPLTVDAVQKSLLNEQVATILSNMAASSSSSKSLPTLSTQTPLSPIQSQQQQSSPVAAPTKAKLILNNNNTTNNSNNKDINNKNKSSSRKKDPIPKANNNTTIKKVIMTVENKPRPATTTPSPQRAIFPKQSITSISAARALIEGRSPQSSDDTPVTPPPQQQQQKSVLAFERYLEGEEGDKVDAKDYYLEKSKESWRKLKEFARQKHVQLKNISDYIYNTSAYPNAEGYFKHVYYIRDNFKKVVQTFRRMTINQRTTEIASLLSLKGKPHVGQITEVLQESHGEVIGLSMERYEKTLKQYTHAHSHHRLTAHQKMDLIIQMLKSIQTIHSIGLAHRDLSEVNFMVNQTDEKLEDGSQKADLYLIDFGKSVFTNPADVKRWWTEHPVTEQTNEQVSDGEVVPKTEDELEAWCNSLPWIYSKPDHGYRLYRSIQTLPRSRYDSDVLLWLINPMAEDMYSLGTIIWKVFAETEPWYGILDTDLRQLRDTVSDDYMIEQSLQREVPGEVSRDLLLQFLRTGPENRKSATEILRWVQRPEIKSRLIAEWQEHAPVGRQKRHAKDLNRYEDERTPPKKRKLKTKD